MTFVSRITPDLVAPACCAILARRTSGLRPRQRAIARQRRLELEHVAWTTDDDLAASGLDDDALVRLLRYR
jgi:hypothetical protein